MLKQTKVKQMPSRNSAADIVVIYMGWLPFHMIVAVACKQMCVVSASHKAGGGRKESAFLQSLLCATIGKSVAGKNHSSVLPMTFQQHLKTQYTSAVMYAVYHNERIYLQNREKNYPFFFIQLSYKLPSGSKSQKMYQNR